jgi:large subunit ribosomal protein L21
MADTKTADKSIKEPKKVAKKAAPKAVKEIAKTDEFAVIFTGGKQYVVSVGDTLTIEKLEGEHKEGDKITFDKVLLVDNGKDTTTVGTPYIKGAKVTGVFQEAGRTKKLHVIRFKSKSRYFKKYGHRQPFNKVKIEALK